MYLFPPRTDLSLFLLQEKEFTIPYSLYMFYVSFLGGVSSDNIKRSPGTTTRKSVEILAM